MADPDSSSSSLIFDVFLSFRGEDTRYTFTDHLYRALSHHKRIKTFRDDPDLRVGDGIRSTIFEAIERSMISVVVLSQNYASSSWCLDELVKIMECSNNGRNRPVFPIFYRVEPSDVRHQRNHYESAMKRHEERHENDLETVKAWRSALIAISNLSGQICTEHTHEGEMIDKIVKEVCEKVPPELLPINHPLEFDSQIVEWVKSLLNIESHDTFHVLGIYGDGNNIDKTDFVVELYNQIRCQFEATSFLANVSAKSKDNGLENLQKILLSEMGEETSKIELGSTFKGTSEIKRRLGCKRILLVLDDVDNVKQLESLAGGGDWFGPGSRIIITTKYEHVLDQHTLDGVEIKKYCIDGDQSHSNQVHNSFWYVVWERVRNSRFAGIMRELCDYDQSKGNKGRSDIAEDVVGLMNNFNVVINQLKGKDSCLNVVSIIGMGGLGKTTLARKIYNNRDVKKFFPSRAWVCVSNDYRVRDIYLSLLYCLKSPESKDKDLDEDQLKEELRRWLELKKYFVVLDDIWEPEVWDKLIHAFPDDNNGSRILITSRNEEVANYTGSEDPYKLPFLNEEESWELFCKKVFWGKKCPSNLELIGKTIVKRLGGLPIAIITIAGVVAKKKRTHKEWSQVKEHLKWQIAMNSTKVTDVLKLSYDNLPDMLKPCFLYLGIYPEDEKIYVRDLIQQWIAEGFIQPQPQPHAPEVEDVGESFFNELVDRSLVQVASRRSDDGAKTCRIHDLLRDLCISLSKSSDEPLEICTEPNLHTVSNPHRLSLQCDLDSCICNPLCTRSLFCFGETISLDILECFRSVNVVYVKCMLQVGAKLSALENWIHLKYLKLHDGRQQQIPECIWELQNLESVYIGWRIDGISVNNNIWKLERLRHINIGTSLRLPADNIGGNKKIIMRNLQSFGLVHIDQQLGFLLNNGSFPNLKKLGLGYRKNMLILGTMWPFFEDRRMMTKKEDDDLVGSHLRSLHCQNNLHTLRIKYSRTLSELSLDNPSVFPSNLTKLTLIDIKGLDFKNMNTLGQIPNLQILKLKHPRVVNGGLLRCGIAGDFPQLQVFHVYFMQNVWEVILEEGAMPRLQRVVFLNCIHLKKVSPRLASLGNLSMIHSTFSGETIDYWQTQTAG